MIEVNKRKGIGGHQSARMESEHWLTPPEVVAALGSFDLDPCAARNQPWRTATEEWWAAGLDLDWFGRVWLNPPYGLQAARWMRKLAEHGNGIAILFARTETRMFFESVWNKASGILFIRGRLHFCRPSGKRAKANSGGPSVLVAYGELNLAVLRRCGIPGYLVEISSDNLFSSSGKGEK